MRLPKVLWVFVLVVSVAYFGYSVYMFYWRILYCSNLATEGSKIPPIEIYDTIAYEKTFRKVCGGGPGFIPIVISVVGMYYGFRGWVLNSVKDHKK
ncbi:MAG: hypothetical protein HYT61_02850 [Candidatus Yanofskybacteria bacterium]|nr:hypothetical protein [Candidatus Yanofskybacteria bacterium]